MAILVGTLTATGSDDFFNNGDLAMEKYTAVATGTATTMSATLTANGASQTALGIYADSAGSPGTLLGSTSAATTTTGTNTRTLTASVDIVSGTAYWLAVLCSGGVGPHFPDRTGGSYQYFSAAGAFNSPPGTPTSTDPSNGIAITADGTLGGGGGAAGYVPHRMPLGV